MQLIKRIFEINTYQQTKAYPMVESGNVAFVAGLCGCNATVFPFALCAGFILEDLLHRIEGGQQGMEIRQDML